MPYPDTLPGSDLYIEDMNNMNTFRTEKFNELFDEVIQEYHKHNDIFLQIENPFASGTLEQLLFAKCLIDTQQWHMEDEVRNPLITAEKGMEWKRKIDNWNQKRTDIVEKIDDFYYRIFHEQPVPAGAPLNTESPAWAIDRLSILALKIYHMEEETRRKDVDEGHLRQCNQKLSVLKKQRVDLTRSINELFEDYQAGKKYMQVYRQVKMYNDPSTNPVLYNKKK